MARNRFSSLPLEDDEEAMVFCSFCSNSERRVFRAHYGLGDQACPFQPTAPVVRRRPRAPRSSRIAGVSFRNIQREDLQLIRVMEAARKRRRSRRLRKPEQTRSTCSSEGAGSSTPPPPPPPPPSPLTPIPQMEDMLSVLAHVEWPQPPKPIDLLMRLVRSIGCLMPGRGRGGTRGRGGRGRGRGASRQEGRDAKEAEQSEEGPATVEETKSCFKCKAKQDTTEDFKTWLARHRDSGACKTAVVAPLPPSATPTAAKVVQECKPFCPCAINVKKRQACTGGRHVYYWHRGQQTLALLCHVCATGSPGCNYSDSNVLHPCGPKSARYKFYEKGSVYETTDLRRTFQSWKKHGTATLGPDISYEDRLHLPMPQASLPNPWNKFSWPTSTPMSYNWPVPGSHTILHPFYDYDSFDQFVHPANTYLAPALEWHGSLAKPYTAIVLKQGVGVCFGGAMDMVPHSVLTPGSVVLDSTGAQHTVVIVNQIVDKTLGSFVELGFSPVLPRVEPRAIVACDLSGRWYYPEVLRLAQTPLNNRQPDMTISNLNSVIRAAELNIVRQFPENTFDVNLVRNAVVKAYERSCPTIRLTAEALERQPTSAMRLVKLAVGAGLVAFVVHETLSTNHGRFLSNVYGAVTGSITGVCNFYSGAGRLLHNLVVSAAGQVSQVADSTVAVAESIVRPVVPTPQRLFGALLLQVRGIASRVLDHMGGLTGASGFDTDTVLPVVGYAGNWTPTDPFIWINGVGRRIAESLLRYPPSIGPLFIGRLSRVYQASVEVDLRAAAVDKQRLPDDQQYLTGLALAWASTITDVWNIVNRRAAGWALANTLVGYPLLIFQWGPRLGFRSVSYFYHCAYTEEVGKRALTSLGRAMFPGFSGVPFGAILLSLYESVEKRERPELAAIRLLLHSAFELLFPTPFATFLHAAYNLYAIELQGPETCMHFSLSDLIYAIEPREFAGIDSKATIDPDIKEGCWIEANPVRKPQTYQAQFIKIGPTVASCRPVVCNPSPGNMARAMNRRSMADTVTPFAQIGCNPNVLKLNLKKLWRFTEENWEFLFPVFPKRMSYEAFINRQDAHGAKVFNETVRLKYTEALNAWAETGFSFHHAWRRVSKCSSFTKREIQMKSNDVKPRVIINPDPLLNVILGAHVQTWTRALKTRWTKDFPVFWTSGRTPEEIGQYFHDAFYSGGTLQEGDVSQWDASMTEPYIKWFLGKLYRKMGMDPVIVRLVQQASNMTFSSKWFRGKIKHNMGSGRPDTTFFNTIVNALVNLFIYARTDDNWKTSYRGAFAGDDSLECVKIPNPNKAATMAQEFALKLVPVYPVDLTEATYCSGSFYPVERDGVVTHVFGPLIGRVLRKAGHSIATNLGSKFDRVIAYGVAQGSAYWLPLLDQYYSILRQVGRPPSSSLEEKKLRVALRDKRYCPVVSIDTAASDITMAACLRRWGPHFAVVQQHLLDISRDVASCVAANGHGRVHRPEYSVDVMSEKDGGDLYDIVEVATIGAPMTVVSTVGRLGRSALGWDRL